MLNRIIISMALTVLLGVVGCKDDDETNAQEAEANQEPTVEAPSSPEKVAKPTLSDKSKKNTAGNTPKATPKRPLKTVKTRDTKKPRNSSTTNTKPATPDPRRRVASRPNNAPTPRADRKNLDEQLPGANEPTTPTPRFKTNRNNKRAKTATSSGSASPRPNAELLLRLSDLREILNVKKSLDVHGLSGLPASDEYDGIYWGTRDGKGYLAGIQIWRPRSPIEAQRRYNDMVRSYPNAQESSAITNKTFLAHWNDFIYLAYLIPGKRTVISLTCHRNACKTPTMLVQLGTRVKERL